MMHFQEVFLHFNPSFTGLITFIFLVFVNRLVLFNSFYFNFITKRTDAAGPRPGPGLDSKAPVNNKKDERER